MSASPDRLEGLHKATGTARYVADLRPEPLAHGALVKSTVTTGRIARIDSSAAESAARVLAVITHRNAPRLSRAPTQGAQGGALGDGDMPLQNDRVRHHGQAIGLVVAETPEQATAAAAELVRVAYAPGPEPAVKLAAPWGVEETPGQDEVRGDLDAGLAQAVAIVDEEYQLATEHNNPLSRMAPWPSGRTAAWWSTTPPSGRWAAAARWRRRSGCPWSRCACWRRWSAAASAARLASGHTSCWPPSAHG